LRAILLLTLAACSFEATGSNPSTKVDGGVVVTTDTRPPDGSSFTPCTGYVSLGAALEPSSYRIVTTPTRFRNAELACEATQGHLVIFDNNTEATTVAAAAAAAPIVSSWVGFSDLKNDGQWIDVAGRASSHMDTRWALNEPSGGGNDNCASLIGVADLNAANCGSKDGSEGDMRGYVCECGDGVQGDVRSFLRPD
jgi:hypothetical protein